MKSPSSIQTSYVVPEHRCSQQKIFQSELHRSAIHEKNKVLRTSYLNLINSNFTAHLSTPSFPTASKQRQWWQGKSFRSSVSGRKSKVKKYKKYYRGPVTKNWLFQLFNKSFCVTGMAPNTPSTKDHNLVGWHFFLCFCAEMSRLDFGEPSMSQVDLIIYHS